MSKEANEAPEFGEDLNLDDILLLSLVMGQQQGQNATPIVNTLLMSKLLGRGRGGFKNALIATC
jgi:hypothetical protein